MNSRFLINLPGLSQGQSGSIAGVASRGFNLVKSGLFCLVFFIIGLVILLSGSLVGLILIGFAVLIFVFYLQSFLKAKRYRKLREDLLNSDIDSDRISAFFTRINSAKPYTNGYRDETENVMILTDKRIIFVYVPLFGLQDLGQGQIVKNLKSLVSYDAFDKKVSEKIKEEGLRNIIESSRRAFAINYSDIENVKVNEFLSYVKFYSGKKKYGYYVLKKDFSAIKNIFKNYIK